MKAFVWLALAASIEGVMINNQQPYNDALAARDEANGYPKLWETL